MATEREMSYLSSDIFECMAHNSSGSLLLITLEFLKNSWLNQELQFSYVLKFCFNGSSFLTTEIGVVHDSDWQTCSRLVYREILVLFGDGARILGVWLSLVSCTDIVQRFNYNQTPKLTGASENPITSIALIRENIYHIH